MGDRSEVEVVVAHGERAVVRTGDVFLKIDPNRRRVAIELAAMERAEAPVPEVLWHRPPVLALARVPGQCLGSPVGDPTAPPAAWEAAGAMMRRLHDQPVSGDWPAWYGADTETFLDDSCRWLADHGHLPSDVVERSESIARRVERPFDAVVVHGDLQSGHVFTDGRAITGVIDWSDTALADPLFDVAVLTLWHPEQLGHVESGYGAVDREVVAGWWALRRLGEVRWLVEHGYDPSPTLAALRTAP